MLYSRLSSSLTVSKLILGTWQFSVNHAAYNTREVDYQNILHSYLKNNITAITSANIYQGAEEKIGLFLNKHLEEIKSELLPAPQILTLFTALPDRMKFFTRQDIFKAVDVALDKLQVNKVDMMQYFCWDLDDSYYIKIGQWLKELQQEGKITNIGVSNVNTRTLEKLLEHDIPIVSNQIQYSLLDRRAEMKMQQFCKRNNVKILSYGVMAGGLLSNKFLNKQQSDFAGNLSTQKYLTVIDLIGGWDAFQNMLQTLNTIALNKNVSISQLASAYILSKDAVAAIILGAHNTNHLTSSLSILDIEIGSDEINLIDSALSLLKQIDGDIYEKELHDERSHGRLKGLKY